MNRTKKEKMVLSLFAASLLAGAGLVVGCGGTTDSIGTPRALGVRECIGDDNVGNGICTPQPEAWECEREGSAATCRRAPMVAPDGRQFRCEHRGVDVSCETDDASSEPTDDNWTCAVEDNHTRCTSKGSLVPPSGAWTCHIEDMGLECEGDEIEVGDDKGGQGEVEHGDDKGGQGEIEPGDDKGGKGEPEPGDDKGGDAGVASADDSGSASSDDSGSASSDDSALRANLPYDVRPQLGQTFRLSDAFAAEGPLPTAVLLVTMDGGSWRLDELKADLPFEITEADCSHQGNRDVGRDRVYVTWSNADGSVQTDHLDLRYCKN